MLAPDGTLVAFSRAMRRASDLVAHAAASDAAVLLKGEAGTGKDHVAREIHARGPRRAGQFIPVRCTSLDETMLEAELFGLDDGAQPSAWKRASGGTLLLDDVGGLSPALQVKILSLLQRQSSARAGERANNGGEVRVIATTSTEPALLVTQGKLRPALRKELEAIAIELPPLRSRREDILPLARMLLDRLADTRRAAPFTLSPEAARMLEAYDWPGNVRQLEDHLARAVVIARNGELSVDCLPIEMQEEPTLDLASLSYRDMLATTRERSTREYLSALLETLDGNVPRAAERAGIERESFYRLLKRCGLDANVFRSTLER